MVNIDHQRRERPILFNGDMVRAILAGQKTQTRRVLKVPHGLWETSANGLVPIPTGCPFGELGDRLWVLETTEVDIETSESVELARYSADRQPVCYPDGTGSGYDGAIQHWWYSRDTCPSIHMPRRACRLALEVTAVRMERLQAISEADAIAEGTTPSIVGDDLLHLAHPAGFQTHWASTGGDWDSNPWVWVIAFKRVEHR